VEQKDLGRLTEHVECLVFQGGGVRAIAHLGALDEVLNVVDLASIRKVAGTSAGGLLSFLIAITKDRQKVFDHFHGTDWSSFAPRAGKWWYKPIAALNVKRKWGAHSLKGAEGWINAALESEDLPLTLDFATLKFISGVDLHVTAANLNTESLVTFSAHNTPDYPVARAVLASMAVPGLFAPVRNGFTLVDGGVAANLPMHTVADEDPEKVLAFALASPGVGASSPTRINGAMAMFGALVRMQLRFSQQHVDDAYWPRVIRTVADDSVQAFDFDLSDRKKQYLLKAGREAVGIWVAKQLERGGGVEET
jgi:NTE family protein